MVQASALHIAGDIWLDFMSKESNKGHAIREIQKILKSDGEIHGFR